MTLRLNGSTSGYTEIDAPAVAGSNTLVLPTGAGSAYQVVRNGATAGSLEFTDKIVSGTAVASTSGTSIDFTGIPSWVKRVTVMLNGVSTNGLAFLLVQIGAGSVTSAGYLSGGGVYNGGGAAVNTSTAGFIWRNASNAATTNYGSFVITLLGSNVWVASHNGYTNDNIGGASVVNGGGNVTLSGTLDRVRITTTNGTDTFDAGSINILYE
jgi:hypothetical protein